MTIKKFRRMKGVTSADVSRIWDVLASKRYEDIASGKDRSYTEVLLPLVENFIRRQDGSSLLDAGCGVGFATQVASNQFEHIDAIDLSPESISIARNMNSHNNVTYHISSIEDFPRKHSGYDALVSSMALMDCVDYKRFVSSCCDLVKPGGRMLFTLCHPFFWPRYWGFEKYSWFNYNSEIAIEANFQTSFTGPSEEKTIYFHRPVSAYINALSSGRAKILSIKEVSGLSVRSATLNRFPRYLAIEAIRTF